MPQKLKVGFDLDGVLLYNPARIARPLIVAIKKLFFKQKVDKFFLPKSRWQKYIWLIFHETSLFVSPGYEQIKKLVAENKIEAYIITARYEFLKADFQKWLAKINAEKYFAGSFYNSGDEQPYTFKQRVIDELKLDIFIEDNWDNVKKLATKSSSTKIFWISNVLDWRIPYQYKFPSLKKAVAAITQKV